MGSRCWGSHLCSYGKTETEVGEWRQETLGPASLEHITKWKQKTMFNEERIDSWRFSSDLHTSDACWHTCARTCTCSHTPWVSRKLNQARVKYAILAVSDDHSSLFLGPGTRNQGLNVAQTKVTALGVVTEPGFKPVPPTELCCF